MGETAIHHVPVLLNESFEWLLGNKENAKSKIYVDGTFGGGGYSRKIIECTDKQTKVIGIDRDENVKIYAKDVIEECGERLILKIDNFSNMKRLLKEENVDEVSGIVLDLGLSSYQLNNEEGFSYQRDSELDMRADKSQSLKAKDVLNEYYERELLRLFKEYGELKYSKQVTRDIISYRENEKFETTAQLVELLSEKIPPRYLNKDLSKIFQALRIEVNDEMRNLEKVLKDGTECLEQGGRLVVISYHSLEDRIVKNSIRENDGLKKLVKKPITPTEEEINLNSSARSAKLRAAEKI